MAQETIVYNTTIDTSGFEQGMRRIAELAKAGMKNVNAEVEGTSKTFEDVAKAGMEAFGKGLQDNIGEVTLLVASFQLVVALVALALEFAAAEATIFGIALSTITKWLAPLVAILAVVGTAFAIFGGQQKEAINETEEYIAKTDELVDRINETNGTIQRNIKRREESAYAAEAEAGSLDILMDSLFELNKKSEKTNEDKAKMLALIEVLNEKVPELALAIDEETGSLTKQENEIRDLIVANQELITAKAAQTILEETAVDLQRTEMELTRTIEAQTKAQEELNDILSDKKETITSLLAPYGEQSELLKTLGMDLDTYAAEMSRASIEELEFFKFLHNLNEEEEAFIDTLIELTIQEQQQYERLEALNESSEELTQTYGELQDTYARATDTLADNQAIKIAMEAMDELGGSTALVAAVMRNETDEIDKILQSMSDSFATATDASLEELTAQTRNLEANTDYMRQALEDGMPGVTNAMVNHLSQMTQQSKLEMEKANPMFEHVSEDTIDSMLKPYSRREGELRGAGGFAASTIYGGALDENPKEDGEDISDLFTDGAILEMKARKREVRDASRELAQETGIGAESADPAGGGRTSGINFGEGFKGGILSTVRGIAETAANMVRTTIAAAKKAQAEASPSKIMRQSGRYFGEGYELGIKDMEKDVAQAASEMVEAAVHEAEDTPLELEMGLSLKNIDVAGLAEKMAAAVAFVSSKLTTSMTASQNYHAVKQAQQNNGLNYHKLADCVVDAFDRSGLKVTYNDREFGRIVREVIG